MAHDEVEAGPGDTPRPRRSSYWRAAVVSGIVVLGAAVAVAMVYSATDQPATQTRAPMMGTHMMDPAQMAEMMKSGQMMGGGQMMQPGRMMGGAMMSPGSMMDPAQMAEMMKSGQHMMDPAQMAEMMKSGQMTGPGPMMGGAR
ncbi:MAG TPA: hypothetical protein VFK43_09075 [Acidimicrobiales bacterium]|nr:hypothetical protein [Acidimicrobiales bacterium]